MSFAKASEELNVTPGAISQQIKLLEDITTSGCSGARGAGSP